MCPMIRRPARRSVAKGAVGFLVVVALAACVAHTHSVADPPTTTQSASTIHEVRLGCGTYCQSAGGLAGTLGPGQDAVTIASSGNIVPDANNYLPVSLTCNLSVQCKGSVVVQAVSIEAVEGENPYALGRSDLLVDAGATVTLGVGLPDRLIAFIRTHNPANVFVIADAGPSFGCDGKAQTPTGGPVLGLPFCGRNTFNGFRAVSANADRLSVAIPG
jgi:hypothetical protein